MTTNVNLRGLCKKVNRLSIVVMYRSLAPLGIDPKCEEPPNQFLQTLPEDVRSDPSISKFKDVGSLAKSYVNAEKLIGMKRVAAPQDNWTEAQWNEFYNAVGRPETIDKYEIPADIKLEEGLKFDDDMMKGVRTELHKAGLTGKQFKSTMALFMNYMNNQVKTAKTSNESSAATAINALKGEWGDKYEMNVDLARSVLKKFDGGEEMQKYVEGSMGNNLPLIKFLAKVGAQFMESQGKGGKGDLPIRDETRAKSEIENLKTDKDFQEALGSARHPGHKAAVDRWLSLHATAHPGKQTEE